MYKLTDNLDLNSAGIPPQTINNTSVNGTGIFMGDAISVVAVCYVGAIHNSAAVAWHLEESADDSSYADISGFTGSHAGTADDTIVQIEIRADQLTSGKDYVRCVVAESGSQNALVAQTWVKNANSKPA